MQASRSNRRQDKSGHGQDNWRRLRVRLDEAKTQTSVRRESTSMRVKEREIENRAAPEETAEAFTKVVERAKAMRETRSEAAQQKRDAKMQRGALLGFVPCDSHELKHWHELHTFSSTG